MIEMIGKIFIEYGPVTGFVISTYMFLAYIIIIQRKDLKSAWKSHHELMKENNKVLGSLNTTMAVLAERIKNSV